MAKFFIFFFGIAGFFHHHAIGENERLHKLINFPHDALQQTGRTIRVAVVDSGLSNEVLSLHQNLIVWKNFVDEEHEGFIDYDAYDGHGTAVIDIIKQFAPDVELLAFAITDRNGAASKERLIKALCYAFSFAPDIINLSVSTDSDVMHTVEAQVGENVFRKTLIVSCAGNDRKMHLAHDKASVMHVAALTLSTPPKLASYSDFGPGVDIAAPAGDAKDGIATIDRYGLKRLFNGTSGATAVVTGVATLLAKKYQLRGQELKNLVIAHSRSYDFIPVALGRVLFL